METHERLTQYWEALDEIVQGNVDYNQGRLLIEAIRTLHTELKME